MARRIDLNGTWKLRFNNGQRGGGVGRLTPDQADLRRALDAAVPGQVHLDLMQAGLLEDPGLGANCLKARWVEEFIWYYRRTFDAAALADGENAYLVFETLDLAAVVYLNGAEVGRHANAFYPCRIDVTGKLRAGNNVVVVQLESGLFHAADRPAAGYSMSIDSQLQKRNWLRQTQSTFGWDWSERLLNVGIRGNAYLEICTRVRFDRLVALAEVSDDLNTGTATARVFVEGLDDKTRKAELTVALTAPNGQPGRSAVIKDLEIKPGANRLEGPVTVDSPALWWPVGHGGQPLYEVKATLRVDGQVVASDSRRVGFRHVRVNQDRHPQGGHHFRLEVNGKPIFVKGGNFVPADLILARLDRKRYETLVERALEANFNMLRIWGGGLYESDDLYELCDERGILVWQEFIFACAKYPAHDEQFHYDVMKEATFQVRRLAHHPSLVVWCGNNEMEWLYNEPARQRGPVYPDYGLFHLVLPTLVHQEDPARYYHPSSPYSPQYEFDNRDDMGDQHPWSIGFGDTDFRKYRQMACRFPNEGGILGPTALPTVRACLPAGQDRVGSFAWEIHDNAIAYWGEFSQTDEMLVQWLGRSIHDMSLEDYVYYAGVVQGEGLAEYIRNFRRRMFDTASAIFWMYNDCWPMVRSWTIVDYFLRRTPAFCPVRRAMQPLSVALVNDGGQVSIYGVNDGPAWKGHLRHGLFALAGGLPVDKTVDISLEPNASTLVAQFDAGLWTRLGQDTHGAFAILSRDGREVARDRLFMPYYKELVWPKAQVSVRLHAGKAVFESKTFAWRICLDLDGELPLPDNFFDVLPAIPTMLDWPAELGEPKILRVGNLV